MSSAHMAASDRAVDYLAEESAPTDCRVRRLRFGSLRLCLVYGAAQVPKLYLPHPSREQLS